MKNKQKKSLSRGALISIFVLVMIATLSGYGIQPVATKSAELPKVTNKETKSAVLLDWALPSLSYSSTFAKAISEPDSSTSPTEKLDKKPSPQVKASVKVPVSLALQPADSELTDEEKIAKIRAYFGKYDLPLAEHAEKFVEISHYCDIDWTLLPAIGMQESTGGKFMRNNNPFGWGSARIAFKDFDEAIEVVGSHLCGLRDSTDSYYKDKTTKQKLWYYNGSVNSRYPGEVMAIMSKIKSTPLAYEK